MDLLSIIGGLALILTGANYLTDGASALAKRFDISEFIIGLTVVAVGTSTPELVVSIFSALGGSSSLAIGNVVGSNIFNTYAILGICALSSPVMLTQRNIKIDIPFGILVSTILLLIALRGTIHRYYGVVMLLIYIAIILFSIKSSRQNREVAKEASPIKSISLPLSIVMLLGGLVGLVTGGNLLLDGAVSVATKFGIPENIIAITLLAGGTSLPELAASVVSIIKGKADIALGNIIGSNIANILLVLGATSTIMPLRLGSITIYDILVLFAGSLLIYLAGFWFKRDRISRGEGAIMLLIFVGYIYFLVS